jgi:hypothetical protein
MIKTFCYTMESGCPNAITPGESLHSPVLKLVTRIDTQGENLMIAGRNSVNGNCRKSLAYQNKSSEK